MSEKLSVAAVLANLEGKIELHRQQEIHHAEQEAFHRDQKALHLAERENATRHYEAFREVAGSAAEVAASLPEASAPAPSPQKEEDLPPADTPALRSRLVARVARERPAGQPFTTSELTAEANRRFAKVLKLPINVRLAAAALRRLVENGEVCVVRQGVPHHEAQYARR